MPACGASDMVGAPESWRTARVEVLDRRCGSGEAVPGAGCTRVTPRAQVLATDGQPVTCSIASRASFQASSGLVPCLHVGQLRGERLLDLRVVQTDRRDRHLRRDVAEDRAHRRVAEVGARRARHRRVGRGLGVGREVATLVRRGPHRHLLLLGATATRPARSRQPCSSPRSGRPGTSRPSCWHRRAARARCPTCRRSRHRPGPGCNPSSRSGRRGPRSCRRRTPCSSPGRTARGRR